VLRYDAQDEAKKHAAELGMQTVPSLDVVFTEEKGYVTADQVRGACETYPPIYQVTPKIPDRGTPPLLISRISSGQGSQGEEAERHQVPTDAPGR
jgi:hypothetical protein